MDNKIKVRPSTLNDCKQFFLWEQTKDVTEFFSIHDNQTYDEVVSEFILGREDESTEFYTITDESEVLLGRIYIGSISRRLDSLEIFRIYIGDPKDRGKGYGRQALLWILKRAFEQDTFHRIYLDYYTDNPAQYLYESVGFEHEGCSRGACKKMGQYHDVHVMSMLREDYEAKYMK